MKRIILTLALIVSVACANTASALGFDWGVTGGLNLTNVSLKGDLKNNLKADNQAGWYLGLKANASIAMGFGVDGAIVYSQQRYSLESTTSSSDVTNKTLRSISIPINLRYNIGLGSVASVYVATGPQFDFNVGNSSWDNVLLSNMLGTSGNSTFSSENMTTSWNVGAGVKILDRVEVGIGYNFALSKTAESIISIASGQSVNTEVKSNIFKVGVAVYF